jgi:hypothetical protein
LNHVAPGADPPGHSKEARMYKTSTRSRRWATLAGIGVVAGIGVAAAPAGAADIQLIGIGEMPGTASDGLELQPPLLQDGTTPHDRAGAWGSGITYTGVGSTYLASPDRGPADGTTSYIDRVYLLNIALAPGTAAPVTVSLLRATTLTNENGELLTGSAAAFDATNSPASRRLDAEAIRLTGDGNFLLSDEYGPFLYEFSPTGERVRSLGVPPKFLIAAPKPEAVAELPPTNLTGRQGNRGMEGLAISPDGSKLYGLMQNALIQDGALDAANKRIGLNVRLVELDRASGNATRELVYPLDTKGNGLNEIVAINDHEFLVIERDGDAGDAAKRKLIYKIDITGATDVSGVASLPTGTPIPGVVPVSKSLFIDLLDPAWGLKGPGFPEKIEGLAFGPRLPDGRLTLLVTSDNDFFPAVSTKVYVFALGAAVLPSFEPQILQPRIDVHPQSRQNLLRPGAPGLVPVAIHGSDLLPSEAFDVRSLRLGGAKVVTLGHRQRPVCARFDENDDGHDDLICVFDQSQIVVPPKQGVIELRGATTSGNPLRAQDRVKVLRD